MILDNMSDTESQCDFEWIREADGGASLEDLCEKHPAVKALCERFESLTEKYEATRSAALVDPSARVARLARLLSRRARVQRTRTSAHRRRNGEVRHASDATALASSQVFDDHGHVNTCGPRRLIDFFSVPR